MTWKGLYPVVQRVATVYETSVKLTHKAMRAVEAKLQRLPKLGQWFVDILPALVRPRRVKLWEVPYSSSHAKSAGKNRDRKKVKKLTL